MQNSREKLVQDLANVNNDLKFPNFNEMKFPIMNG
jgi:hypothetical protein